MVRIPTLRPAVIGFFGAIILLSTITIAAQATRNITTTGRRLDDFTKQNDKIALDQMESEMRGRKMTAEERRLAEAKKAQLREDFTNLQAAYNDIVRRLTLREKLTPQYLSEVTDNISNIADRLRSNVPFPARTAEQNKTDAAVPVSLLALCKEIHSFLTSPMFEKAAVFEISVAEKTRDTLENILRIAESLRQQTTKSD